MWNSQCSCTWGKMGFWRYAVMWEKSLLLQISSHKRQFSYQNGATFFEHCLSPVTKARKVQAVSESSRLLGLHRAFHTVVLERSTALVGYQKQPQSDSSPYSWAQNIWEGSPRGGVSWPVACWEVVSADQWCLLLLCSFYFSKLSVAKNCFSIFNYKISGWWIPNSSQNCNCT